MPSHHILLVIDHDNLDRSFGPSLMASCEKLADAPHVACTVIGTTDRVASLKTPKLFQLVQALGVASIRLAAHKAAIEGHRAIVDFLEFEDRHRSLTLIVAGRADTVGPLADLLRGEARDLTDESDIPNESVVVTAVAVDSERDLADVFGPATDPVRMAERARLAYPTPEAEERPTRGYGLQDSEDDEEEEEQQVGSTLCTICRMMCDGDKLDVHVKWHNDSQKVFTREEYVKLQGLPPDDVTPRKNKASGQEYPCEICKTPFKTLKSLSSHKGHHTRKGIMTAQDYEVAKKAAEKNGSVKMDQFVCGICDQVYDTARSLGGHKGHHTRNGITTKELYQASVKMGPAKTPKKSMVKNAKDTGTPSSPPAVSSSSVADGPNPFISSTSAAVTSNIAANPFSSASLGEAQNGSSTPTPINNTYRSVFAGENTQPKADTAATAQRLSGYAPPSPLPSPGVSGGGGQNLGSYDSEGFATTSDRGGGATAGATAFGANSSVFRNAFGNQNGFESSSPFGSYSAFGIPWETPLQQQAGALVFGELQNSMFGAQANVDAALFSARHVDATSAYRTPNATPGPVVQPVEHRHLVTPEPSPAPVPRREEEAFITSQSQPARTVQKSTMPFPCPICPRGFDKKTSLTTHKGHHSRKGITTSEQWLKSQEE
ncbi:hypothetical protein HK101_009534 [Irineochytrium annulatum]|nr:hypothetical protein HK101_009534 [Irineochytrium annulatum]